jgi:hypothetical protein
VAKQALKVELFYSGTWHDLGTDPRVEPGVTINHGRASPTSEPEPTEATFTLNNRAGTYNPENASSALYGLVGRNTPCRISVGSDVRMVGEVTRWRPQRTGDFDPVTGKGDAWTEVEVSGILHRLGQGADPLRSPLYRVIRPAAGLVAYWPMEDGSSARSFAPVTRGTSAMRIAGEARPAASSDVPGSAPLPQMGAPVSLTAGVPAYSPAEFWFYWVMWIPPAGFVDGTHLIDLYPDSGGVFRWQAIWGTGGTFNMQAVDAAGSVIGSSGAQSWLAGGGPFFFSMHAHNDGFGNIVFDVSSRKAVSDRIAPLILVSPVVAGATLGPIRRIVIGSAGNLTDAAYGHVALSTAGIGGMSDAVIGYTRETAAVRLPRLATEEDVALSVSGTCTEELGPQYPDELVALFAEAERTDDGLLFDRRTVAELRYRTGPSLFNQAPALTLDYTAGATPALPPDIDDLLSRNDVTAKRRNGGEARAVLESGPLSILPPPAGIGRTSTSVDVNPWRDAELPNHASWHLHKGTLGGVRFPKVTVDIDKLPGAAAVDVGDLLVIDNMPLAEGPKVARLLVVGDTERIDSHRRLITFNTTPYDAFHVLELESTVDNRGRLDTGGSILTSSMTTGATTAQVRPPDAADNTYMPRRWAVGAYSPDLILQIGAEVLTASAVANDPSFVAAGTAAHADWAAVTPGLPAGLAQGDQIFLLAVTRGAGAPNLPAGYTQVLGSIGGGNAQLFRKTAGASESAPTVTFSGGAVGDTCTAQMCAFRGLASDRVGFSASQANASAQDIDTPVFRVLSDVVVVLKCMWKADDSTGITQGTWTEIGDLSSVLGNDMSTWWGYKILTDRKDQPPETHTVSGGLAAVSGARLIAYQGTQTMTVARSVNGVVQAHSAGDPVALYRAPVVAK